MTGDAESARTVVVAVGGNALSPSGESASVHNQFRHTRESLESIVPLAVAGWRIAIVHGNGPQVGDALVRNEAAIATVDPLPLGVLVAGTAGWIGYMIQQSLENALAEAGCDRRVVTLICQARVDAGDPALREPTKFVGRTLDEATAEALRKTGLQVEADGNGNLRRRVPSPLPVEIVESRMVSDLVSRGDIVIAAGGGGIPVYRDEKLGLEGVDAVVDKDRAAAILGRDIGAEMLVILTDVDGVYTGWGTDASKKLSRLTLSEARALLDGPELGSGSMRPKVEAAASFVANGGARSVIAALEDGPRALEGGVGTEIVPDE
ncbi:MAG: carbamate kinase [Gemmatimonadota bacterium]